MNEFYLRKTTETQPKIVKNMQTTEIEKRDIWSRENILMNLLTGSLLFVLTIAIGIGAKLSFVNILEKTSLEDRWIFIISNLFTMLILIVLSIYTAPYMGWGINPFLD